MEMFKSSPFKAPPVVHISFITTLQADVDHGPGKIQGWFFFTKGQGEFEDDFPIDHGPGKIQGWSFIYQDGKVTTAYFWKFTTKFFI